MLEIVGHIGSVFLMLCGLPQLYRTLMTKNVEGLSPVSLVLWSLGCILMGVYVFMTTPQLPLIINYAFNALVAGVTAFLYFANKKHN